MKKQTEEQPKQIEFRFVSVLQTEKKNHGFKDSLKENVFWRFFGLFHENSVCFGCFDTGPKHRNKLKQTEKNFFGFRETKRKTKRTQKKFDCFKDTLVWLYEYQFFLCTDMK
jgi:hypothetical protein